MNKEDKKLIYKAFSKIFLICVKNTCDKLKLSFDFKICKTKFKVELLEIIENKEENK